MPILLLCLVYFSLGHTFTRQKMNFGFPLFWHTSREGVCTVCAPSHARQCKCIHPFFYQISIIFHSHKPKISLKLAISFTFNSEGTPLQDCYFCKRFPYCQRITTKKYTITAICDNPGFKLFPMYLQSQLIWELHMRFMTILSIG